MTRQEELLNYINTELTGMDFLNTVETVMYAPDDHALEFGGIINKEVQLKTEKLIHKITNNFDEELIGKFSDDDTVVTQIQSWDKVPRPIHMYE